MRLQHKGPWRRAALYTVVQNVSGITTRQGELFPGAEPGPQFYPFGDRLSDRLSDGVRAMVALRAAAREGGSWLVRISLAQTGRWLSGAARCRGRLKDAAKEIPPARSTAGRSRGHAGRRLRHLGPTVQLSETPPHWARPRSRSDTTSRSARPRGVTPGRATPAQRLPCGFDVNLQRPQIGRRAARVEHSVLFHHVGLPFLISDEFREQSVPPRGSSTPALLVASVCRFR